MSGTQTLGGLDQETREQWSNPRLGRRIPELDGLRGIAILLVLVYHYVTAIGAPHHAAWGVLTTASRLFWSGVDLFFVLSGFLIAGILMDARQSGNYFRTFYARRIHRIFPLYFGWLLLFFLGLMFNLDGRLGANLFRSDAPLWAYPVFAQNNVPLWFNRDLPLWMAMSWSVALEEQFYLFLPLLVKRLSRAVLATCCAALVVASPVYRFALVSRNPALNDGWPFATVCRLDGLALGALIAIAVRNQHCWRWLQQNLWGIRISAALASLAVTAMTFLSPGRLAMAAWGFTTIDVLYASLLILALPGRDRWLSSLLTRRTLIYFGTISYGVYIFHQGVRGLAGAMVPQFHPAPLRYGLVFGASLLATVLLAHISWHTFEKKLIRRAHARHTY